jgi:hypothetical protein
LLAALALLVSNVATASAAGPVGLPAISLLSPGVVEPGVSTAVTLQLPASVAAVEGRLLVNDDALEFIGVAPRGGGTALRPVETGQGVYAFAAYGLSSAKGRTTLDLVVFPKVAGQRRPSALVRQPRPAGQPRGRSRDHRRGRSPGCSRTCSNARRAACA